MGVWIETYCGNHTSWRIESHPVWVCGLKQIIVGHGTNIYLVTPCMGVWIETLYNDTKL